LKKVLVLVLWFYCFDSSLIQAQESAFEDIVAAYVYRFIEFTSWPDEQSQSNFEVVYLGDDKALLLSLKKLTDKTIRGKNLTLRQTTNVEEVIPAQVIFVDETYLANLREVNVLIARRPILVISVNAKEKQRIGINLVQKEQNLQFEVNRYNLVFQGLTVTQDVILIGGTEIDIAELLKDMERELSVSRKQLSSIQSVLNNKEQSLVEKERLIREKQAELKVLEANFRDKQQENEQLRQQYSTMSSSLKTKKSEVENYVNQLRAQQNNVIDKSQQLAQLNVKINQQQSLVEEQGAEIAEQRNNLTLLVESLAEKSKQLDNQTSTIFQQDKTIDKQSTLLLLFLGMLVSVFITTVVIIRWARQKSNLNQQLNTAMNDLNETNIRLVTTQDQLVNAEKLAALGGLVAGISHEVNTPIGISVTASSIISDKLSTIRAMFKSGKVSRTQVEKLLTHMTETSELLSNNLERAKELIYSFKQVSVDQISEELRKINLDEYLQEICRNLYYLLKKGNHTVQINCPDDLITYTSPGALAQIISNLVINSVEHGFKDMDKGQIDINVMLKSENIVIDYKDNGVGLTEKFRKKVFEPFFTSRRSEGNTGLGMYISHNLVYQTLQGIMTCEESKQGAHFVIKLPLEINLDIIAKLPSE
jgi:signal transduction histidine kinase